MTFVCMQRVVLRLSSILSLCILFTGVSRAQESAIDLEPIVEGEKAIDLIRLDSLGGWMVPSKCWSIDGGVITGDTGPTP